MLYVVCANRFGICVCVCRCGADGKYLPYLTLFIQTLLQRDLPYLYIPKNIIISTNYQLINSPYLNIVIINICLTLLGYFPGHIHA